METGATRKLARIGLIWAIVATVAAAALAYYWANGSSGIGNPERSRILDGIELIDLPATATLLTADGETWTGQLATSDSTNCAAGRSVSLQQAPGASGGTFAQVATGTTNASGAYSITFSDPNGNDQYRTVIAAVPNGYTLGGTCNSATSNVLVIN